MDWFGIRLEGEQELVACIRINAGSFFSTLYTRGVMETRR